MLGQFGPGQLFALAVFADGDHGHGIVATAQQVFGEVQGGAGEPLGAGHLRAFDQHRVGLLWKRISKKSTMACQKSTR
jgi:hypothetical protein